MKELKTDLVCVDEAIEVVDLTAIVPVRLPITTNRLETSIVAMLAEGLEAVPAAIEPIFIILDEMARQLVQTKAYRRVVIPLAVASVMMVIKPASLRLKADVLAVEMRPMTMLAPEAPVDPLVDLGAAIDFAILGSNGMSTHGQNG